MPLIHLLFLFHLQEALHGFHTPDFTDSCYKPFLGLSAINKAIQNNISLYCRHTDLEMMCIRVFVYYLIDFCSDSRVVDKFTLYLDCHGGTAEKQG